MYEMYYSKEMEGYSWEGRQEDETRDERAKRRCREREREREREKANRTKQNLR